MSTGLTSSTPSTRSTKVGGPALACPVAMVEKWLDKFNVTDCFVAGSLFDSSDALCYVRSNARSAPFVASDRYGHGLSVCRFRFGPRKPMLARGELRCIGATTVDDAWRCGDGKGGVVRGRVP